MWRDGWYVVPYDVIFRDLDPFGHVNNAVYFTWFENVRTRLWFALSGGAKWDEIGFIVAHAECDYKLQLGLESVDLCVRIGDMRTTSFDTLYEICRNGEVAATGKVTVVLYDWARRSKVPIAEELRRKVQELQA